MKKKNNVLIKEGLICSISYSKFIEKLENLLNKNNMFYDDIIKKEDGVSIKKLVTSKNKNFFQELISLLNLTGYYISSYNNGKLNISFNKNFDFEDTGIKTILYHLTDKKYYNKIKEIGLIPKSKKKLLIIIQIEYIFLNF